MDRRITIVVPATGQRLEVSGVVAEMVMLLYANEERIVTLPVGERVRFVRRSPKKVQMYIAGEELKEAG